MTLLGRKGGGFPASLNLANLDGDNGIRLDGSAGGDYFGHSVSSAGDLNGDGYDDLIAGARLFAYPIGAYVVFGSSSIIKGGSGNAGTIAKPLGIVLGQGNWYNREYIGIGLDLIDNTSISFDEPMGQAFDFILGSDPSDKDVVNLIFTNLVGQALTLEEVNTLVADFLESGTYTQGRLGVLAAGNELNLLSINLVGIAEAGLQYFATARVLQILYCLRSLPT